LREYKPSLNIRLAIAGRDQPGVRWDPLRSVTQTIRIDVFTEREAEAFLDDYAITDTNRRKEVLELSGRLPVLMSWLTAVEGSEAEISLPTRDIVERFLRWVTEPALRQVALVAAIPRTLNADVLQLLLEQRGQAIDEQSAFDWLQTMPFVKQGSEGWYYHDVVRRMILHYQRQKSPQRYRQRHAALANFFNTKRQEVSSSEEEQWRNEEWRKHTLAYVYHLLVAHPTRHWTEVMSLFVVALRKRRTFAFELIEMFDKLCGIIGLSSQAKGYALAERGDCHRLKGEREKALSDFEEALRHIPEDAQVIASRGVTYRVMGHYQDALADLDHAITLDEKFAWAINNRGVTYYQMGRYQDALADLDHSITLNEKASWSFANRGWVYLRMERYEEALADFDRAIALDEKSDWYWYCRALIYLLANNASAFESDIDTAIKKAQSTLNKASTTEYRRMGFNLALYSLVSGNITNAELQYTQLVSACVSIPALQGAENDLKDLLRIQPTNNLAQIIRAKLLTRISELTS